MNKPDKAKIIAWTLQIQRLQDKINNLQQQAKRLDNKRVQLLKDHKGQEIESIDISNVDLETFEGEIEIG